MKSKLILLLLVGFLAAPAGAWGQQGSMREYPYFYKSTRAMGMGGIYTAVGDRVDTLFYNPAGLQTIPADKGWEVNIITLNAELGKRTEKFVRGLGNATKMADTNGNGTDADERLQAVNDALAQYRGSNLHELVSNFTSIARKFGPVAIGVGAYGMSRLDALTHTGLGADGFLEANYDLFYGIVGGISYALSKELSFGVGVKGLHRESVVHNFTARELVLNEHDFNRLFMDDYRVRGEGVGADAGFIWRPARHSVLRPSFGVSVLNIGDTKFGNAGTMPMTVNTGFAFNIDAPLFRALIVGVDFIDATYNYPQDKDASKRLRYGAELQLFDVLPFELTLRAGYYQKFPSVGFDVRALLVRVSYAMYNEELGAYAGQDGDIRHRLTLNVGW